MNTEIFDYLKALSKKEFFFVNLVDIVGGIVIIISGFMSVRNGASVSLYAIMFASATVMLGMNAYKCAKRNSKNKWVFAILCCLFLALTALAAYAVMKGA